MIRASLKVSVLAAFNAGAAFASQLVFAATFGAAAEFDGYLVAISLPLTIAGLGAGVLGFQIVPALTGRPEGAAFGTAVRGMILGLGGVAVGAALAGLGANHRTIPLLTGGSSAVDQALAIEVGLIAWWWLPLAVVGAILTGALHVQHKFTAATLPQSFPAVGAMLGCVLGHESLGVLSLAWGQLVGYLAMVTLLLVSLRLAPGAADWAAAGRLMRGTPLALAALLIFIIYPLPDAIFGARAGVSGVSLLGYAQRLIVGFSGLAVVGATTVIFPHLAVQVARGDHEGFKDNLARGLRLMLVCMVPAGSILAVLAFPLVRVLFARGAFGDAEAAALAGLLRWMFAGMIAMSCMSLAFKALFAQGRILAAARLSAGSAVIYFALSGLLVDVHGLPGIGAAYAVTWWLLFFGMLCTLGLGRRSDLAFAARLSAITALASGAAWTSRTLLHESGLGHATVDLFTLAAGGISAALAFAAGCLVWPGLPEAKSVWHELLGRHDR